MDKAEKLKKIAEITDFDKLNVIIQNILQKNFLDIHTVDNLLVYATMETPIGFQKIAVYPFYDRLSGDHVEVDKIGKKIISLFDEGLERVIIVSSKNITGGFKGKIKQLTPGLPIDYWESHTFLDKIEEGFPEFWRHADQHLTSYEKVFEDDLMQDWSLNKVKQIKTANDKLLKIFIEPRLYLKKKDQEARNSTSIKIPISQTTEYNIPVVLYGDAGVGKTRTLKQIGLEHIKNNALRNDKKFLPIFINNVDLIETKDENNQVNLVNALEAKVQKHFVDENLVTIKEKYILVLLIDSIDEFSADNQSFITKELLRITKGGHKLFIGTRLQELTQSTCLGSLERKEEIKVEKFNEHQIRLFLASYFQNDSSKANNLMQSLKENSIIQRLPITPLNLSLISILYEENNFEIPATITDIYDNFNNLLLGRTLADKKLDFFDITFRERIISLYALELLSREERSYMTKEEFVSYFQEHFKDNSGTLNLDQLPEALSFIIENTGILVLQDGKFVKFLHESYMEYYASRELFIYQRERENELIDNFLDISWQYTSIFYAGRSKQMESFLKKIINHCNKTCHSAQQFLSSIHGLGYLLQSLYLTSDNIRKEAVMDCLSYSLEILDWMKKSGADDKYFFKRLNLPIAVMINSMFFIENFNSITLKGPLIKAFEQLLPTLESTDEKGVMKVDPNVGYKLFTIALTLASPRIGNTLQMERLLETSILNDPLFEKLLDFGVTVAKSKELYAIKEKLKSPSRDLKNPNLSYNKQAIDIFLSTPVGRLRFSQYDRIRTERKYLLLTEGKTDAQIIEHAFTILTNKLPYWEVRPVNDENGGAKELANSLMFIDNIAQSFDGVIGIFDNDSAGISSFKGLLEAPKYSLVEGSDRVKKNSKSNVYGVKLPIPFFRQEYLKPEQEFNFFEIEHYFEDSYLTQYGMLTNSPIPNIYKIVDSSNSKTSFSKKVREDDDHNSFKHFGALFKQIDEIFMIDGIDYKD